MAFEEGKQRKPPPTHHHSEGGNRLRGGGGGAGIRKAGRRRRRRRRPRRRLSSFLLTVAPPAAAAVAKERPGRGKPTVTLLPLCPRLDAAGRALSYVGGSIFSRYHNWVQVKRNTGKSNKNKNKGSASLYWQKGRKRGYLKSYPNEKTRISFLLLLLRPEFARQPPPRSQVNALPSFLAFARSGSERRRRRFMRYDSIAIRMYVCTMLFFPAR